MAFDADDYERDVVRPLRNRRGAIPPPPALYAVAPGMDRAALEAHLRRVRAYWGQKARTGTNVGMVCRQLIAADEQLRAQPGVDLSDPGWWRRQFAEHTAQQRTVRQKLVTALKDAYGAAGQITEAQLQTVARHFGGVGDAQAAQAARDAGLAVIESLELPRDCGLSHTQFAQLRDRMAEAGARTVVHLLHPDLGSPFAIAHGFAVADRPELRLEPAELHRAAQRAESAADSTVTRARKSALALLRSAYTKVPDLTAITLYHLVDQVRESRHAGMPASMLAAQLADLGVTRADAGLIAVSLPGDVGDGPGAVRGLDRVQELIEARRLGEARAALAALPVDHPERAAATAVVDQAVAALETYLMQAAEAERRHDVARAAVLLQQAAELDADNPAVTGMLDRLPAPEPVQLTLVEQAFPPGARLAWAAGPGAAGALTYRVVRGEDRPPVNEDDGVRVAQSSERQAVDQGVTPGRRTFYAVFATADGSVWSRPATVSGIVLPRVGDVVLDVAADRIGGRWRVHPAAVRVRVRRSVERPPAGGGTPVAVTGDSFRDTGVLVDRRHFYELTAVYRDVAGREVTAAPVVVSAVPRGAAGTVADLTVEPVSTADGTARVRLSWSAGAADAVQVRRADRAPAWPPGESVTAAQVRGFGAELVGSPFTADGRTTMECVVPTGRHVYVPFAFGAGGAVVGRPVTAGVAAPVTAARLRRLGDRLTVTWLWPDEVAMAEVRWDTPEGAGTRVVTRAGYDAESGCVLTATAAGGTVEIRSLTVGPAGTAKSPPVRLNVAPRPTPVAYTVSRPVAGGPLARLRERVRDRRRVVVLSSEQECDALDVVVVAAAGVAMPLRAAQGTEIAREHRVRLGPDAPHTIEVEVPASIGRPGWIRCFVSRPGGCVVVDPPIEQMRVG